MTSRETFRELGFLDRGRKETREKERRAAITRAFSRGLDGASLVRGANEGPPWATVIISVAWRKGAGALALSRGDRPPARVPLLMENEINFGARPGLL